MEKEQTMRYSEEQLEILRKTFGGKQSLLKVVRKVILQKDLTDEEKAVVFANFQSKELMKIMRLSLCPEIEGNEPISQPTDLYSILEIKNLPFDLAIPQIMAVEKVRNYLFQQMQELEGGVLRELKFDDFTKGETPEELYVNLTARKMILEHTERQLGYLVYLSSPKEEQEKMIERMAKNSSE